MLLSVLPNFPGYQFQVLFQFVGHFMISGPDPDLLHPTLRAARPIDALPFFCRPSCW